MLNDFIKIRLSMKAVILLKMIKYNVLINKAIVYDRYSKHMSLSCIYEGSESKYLVPMVID